MSRRCGIPGLSFSWKRALGVSQAQAKLSRQIGITLDELPEAFRKELPSRIPVPASLLGRLAMDQRFKRQGLGGSLLT